MATLVLVIGVLIFLVGIGGQFAVGRRFSKQSHAGDRKGLRLVLTLAAIVVGAWMVIISASAVLDHRAISQQHTANPS